MAKTLVLTEFQTPRLALVLSIEKPTQLPQKISFFARTESVFLKIAAGLPPGGPVVQHTNKLGYHFTGVDIKQYNCHRIDLFQVCNFRSISGQGIKAVRITSFVSVRKYRTVLF